jgi:hypothetical protein
VLRYFVRIAEKIVWADRPEELMKDLLRGQELPPGIDPPLPMSVTFIPATVFDNPALLRVNPEYITWLLSLPTLERERLLAGNWKIRPAAGLYFKREWCAVVDEAPADLDIVRFWDLAATEKTQFNDPDWTVGVKLGRDRSGNYWVLDMVRARANPGDVEQVLLNTATQDGKRVTIGFGQDPGQAGKSQAQHLVRGLSGFTVRCHGAQQATTCSIRAPARLDGVVRGAEEERLNHGGSRADMGMHDVDNLRMPLGGGAGARLQVWINTRLPTGDPDLHSDIA